MKRGEKITNPTHLYILIHEGAKIYKKNSTKLTSNNNHNTSTNKFGTKRKKKENRESPPLELSHWKDEFRPTRYLVITGDSLREMFPPLTVSKTHFLSAIGLNACDHSCTILVEQPQSIENNKCEECDKSHIC